MAAYCRHSRAGVLLAVAVVCRALAVRPAAAGCTLGSEASQLKRSVRLAARCNDRILPSGVGAAARRAPGVAVPGVGPQRAAALPPPGSGVDSAALRDCVHTLLGVWVERWGPNPQPLRPNIVFILTDDQRRDTTDATHSPSAAAIMPRTRAELADHGVEFPEAFMTTPLCCPSRSSILSGQYSHRTGVYKNGGNNGGADDFDDGSSVGTWLQ